MVIPLYFGVLLGLLLFALLSHLQIAIKSGWPRRERAFLTGVVAVLLYSASTFMEYQEVNLGTYFLLLRVQVAAEPVIFISLIEFILAESGETREGPVSGFYVAFIAFSLLRIALPFTGIYASVSGMRSHTLPWGEAIELVSGQGTALVVMSYLFFLMALAIAAVPLLRMYARGRRGAAAVLLAAELVLVGGIAFDFAVAIGFLRWFYVAEGTFVIVALFQNFEVTGHVIAEAQLKQALESSLDERGMLLAEVHHRVKNNLQVVASLLSLKAGRSSSSEAKNALDESAARVLSMALVHEQLYSSGDYAEVDFSGFSSTLINALSRSNGRDDIEIELITSISGLPIGLDMAVPLGIILNELVMNSIKHAATEGEPLKIRLSTHHKEGRIVLEYDDNGKGFDPASPPKGREGLGTSLIVALIRQLDARGGYVPDAPGARFRIDFAPRRRRPDRSAGKD